ncbi:MAG: glycosyltransferase [Anaerolineae bacterium]|jgi:glycosyltransferase involved in cell wall biosynthesis
MRILFIAPYLPSLIRVRPYNLIHALAQRGHHVTLLALHPPGDDTSGLPNLRQWCRSVQVVQLPRWRPPWNGLRAIPTPSLPFQAAYSRSPLMSQRIRRTLQEERYDVIHLEHLRGAELAHAINVDDPPLVFDAVDSISLLFERAKQGAPRWQSRLLAWLDLGRTRRYEAQFTRRFSRVLVTSPEDCDALATLAAEGKRENGRLVVLPNGVDLAYFKPLDEPRQLDTVVFSGKMSYHANTAAALDLVQAVMPIVWSERPQTQVWLAGKDPPEVVRALGDDPRVTVTGTVPDLRPYVGRAAVAVTPLRYSVGIQNKVLEAMAMSTPVVTTPTTCRALAAEPGTHLLVGESAPSLAQAILSLLNDDERRRELGQAGRRYIQTHHDWDRIAARLESVYQDVQVTGT